MNITVQCSEMVLITVQLRAIKEERLAHTARHTTARLAADRCRYHTVKTGPHCSGVLHQYASLVAADTTDTGTDSSTSVQLDWNVHKSGDYSRRKAVLDRLIALVGR
jgi:hypothetical protein